MLWIRQGPVLKGSAKRVQALLVTNAANAGQERFGQVPFLCYIPAKRVQCYN